MCAKPLSPFQKTTFTKSNAVLLSLVTLTLVGCGGSGSSGDPTAVVPATEPPELPPPSDEGGQLGVFNPSATLDVFACEAPYYLELRGLYTGTVSFTPAGSEALTCTWDASLQVRGSFEDPADTSVCDIDATYSYTLVSGDSSCADGSLESPLIDPLANPVDRSVWENPPYPVDLPTDLEPITPTLNNPIIPLSNLFAENPEVVWQFNGLDTAVIIDTIEVDGTVDGFLIKR